jgi:single-strand DNA-binding protein
MQGVNKVILIGRLGADPESRMTPNGQQVCSLRVATSESYQKDGQREEKTEWHSVVLWGRLAELASKYLRKGRSCYIEGRIQTRSWDDPQGQKRYKTEIVANQLQFIDSATGRQNDVGGDMPADTGDASYGGGNGGNGGGNAGGGYGGGQQPGGYDAPQGRSAPAGGNSYKAPDIDEDVPF